MTASQTCYVYGVVDAGSPPAPANLHGLAGAPVGTVSCGNLAAVVSKLPDSAEALGTRDDLLAHDRVVSGLLDTGVAVLPLRFGAVISGEQAVADELLASHRDALAAALDGIRGRVQFTVRASYERDHALRAVISTNPRLAELRESAGRGGLGAQLRLGEQVVAALAELRDADAPRLMEQLGRSAEAVHLHEPSEADEVLNAAFLVSETSRDAFIGDAERLAEQWHGRLHIRLTGPQACYDFIPEER